MRRRLAAAALVAVLAACGGSPPTVKLDGSPRFPDDEGVATTVELDRIVLDGTRTYGVSRDLRSFSTYDMRLEPMLNRRGHYVHVGLEDRRVVWMAGIAAVLAGDPPRVFYSGRLKALDKGRAIFADGTVLTLQPGLASPVRDGFVQVEIDARAHRVRRMTVP
jgi:hypothetical protein